MRLEPVAYKRTKCLTRLSVMIIHECNSLLWVASRECTIENLPKIRMLTVKTDIIKMLVKRNIEKRHLSTYFWKVAVYVINIVAPVFPYCKSIGLFHSFSHFRKPALVKICLDMLYSIKTEACKSCSLYIPLPPLSKLVYYFLLVKIYICSHEIVIVSIFFIDFILPAMTFYHIDWILF